MGVLALPVTGVFSLPGEHGPTLFGSAPDAVTALNDSSDTTGIHWGTTYDGFYQHWTYIVYGQNMALPATARIDWIRIDYRARHIQPYSYMLPFNTRAFDGQGVPHYRNNPVIRPAGDPSPVDVSSWTTRGADDGTPWDVARIAIHAQWGHWGPGDDQVAWDPSNYPYLVKTSLAVGYTLQPVVTNVSPTGTTEDPRPTITWALSNIEETAPSAHQVVILPTGSVDAGGHAIGDPSFDPDTGSGAAYNSGKVIAPATTQKVASILTPALWKVFVRQWVGTGIDEYASTWVSSNLTVDAQTVDTPVISLNDHAASNTVQVVITAGAHVEDLVAATIEVEYLDPAAGWVTAPIANGMVNGTGTSVFYDGLHAPGEFVSYRARGVAVFDTAEFASAWATATHTVAATHQWWLRSSSDYTLNRNLHDNAALLMREWAPTRTRPTATTWGIGARPATQIHDITKGDVHNCTIWAMTQTAYGDLRALIEDGDDLVLVNPWGELWRVQPGNEVKEEVVRAAPRSSEATALGFVRIVTVSFVEVVTP